MKSKENNEYSKISCVALYALGVKNYGKGGGRGELTHNKSH